VPASGAAEGTVALATTSLAAQLDEWRGCSGRAARSFKSLPSIDAALHPARQYAAVY